jgi:hypothetical protein
MVLPGFGEFTGVADIAVEPDDRVWVIADGGVIGVSVRSHMRVRRSE